MIDLTPAQETAVKFIKRGFHIFPLQGKTPLADWNWKKFNLDVESVGAYSTNFGLACGNGGAFGNNWFVLDIDNFQEWYEYQESTGNDLPDTYNVLTSKGLHYYLRAPEGFTVRNSVKLKGMEFADIRAKDGYVVLAGSRHPETGFTYDDCHSSSKTAAEAPKWLLDIISSSACEETKRTEYAPVKVAYGTTKYGEAALNDACNTIASTTNGGRNHALNEQAYSIFQLVAGGEIVENDAMSRLSQAAKCCGLKDKEILLTLKSAKKGGTAQPRKPEQKTEEYTQQQVSDAVIESEGDNLESCLDVSDIDITKPHGILGAMCDEMKSMARRRLDVAYPLYGLQTLAMLAGKRSGFDGSKINIITMLIAESGTGKDVGQEFFKQASAKVGHSTFSQPRSDKQMILSQFKNGGIATYICDEAHGFFSGIKGNTAPAYLQGIGSTLLGLSTSTLQNVDDTHRADVMTWIEKEMTNCYKTIDRINGNEDKKTSIEDVESRIKELEEMTDWVEYGIPRPVANMAAASTPRKFDNIVSEDTLDDGLLARSLLIKSDIIERKQARTQREISDHLSFRMNSIKMKEGEIEATMGAIELLDMIDDFYEQDNYRYHPIMGALYRRLHERVITVASILAIDSGIIEVADVRYALALVLRSFNDVKFLSKQNDQEKSESLLDTAAYIQQSIMRNINGNAYKSHLVTKLDKTTKAMITTAKKEGKEDIFDKVLASMIDKGQVKMVGKKIIAC